jgi:hypothetical protein
MRTGGQLLLVLKDYILNDGKREILVLLVEYFPILLAHLLDDGLLLFFCEVNFIEMGRDGRGFLF